jgi:hypothetical protein
MSSGKGKPLRDYEVVERVALQAQRLQAGIHLWHLRRGWKPRPFKAPFKTVPSITVYETSSGPELLFFLSLASSLNL